MKVALLDWIIIIIPMLAVLWLAVFSKRYVRGVADFLAAGRVAGRYVMSVGDLSGALSIITLVGLCEAKYQTGYAVDFWSQLTTPVSLVLALTGFCVYRWRQTRALSFGQFLEMRYSRSFRIFASALRTLSEMITNALGPAVAVNFFIYFLGLPHEIEIFGINLPCFSIILVILIVMAMICVWPGGRVSLMITDCIQGLIMYPVYIIIVFYILYYFSWGDEITPVMADRVSGESFLNPFDVANLRDFNIFAITVNLLSGAVLNRASWFGNDSTNSGRTPHEQKMAGILGAWRNGFSMLMFTVIAALVITVMNHKNFATEAKEIRDSMSTSIIQQLDMSPDQKSEAIKNITSMPELIHNIGVDAPMSQADNLDTKVFDAFSATVGTDGEGNRNLQEFRTMYNQQMMAVTLKHIFPVGIIGIFALLSLMLVLSTDNSRIFNAAATIVQDVILPFKKEQMSPQKQLLALRLCSVAVALFFVAFSIFFVQLDYLNMFMIIMASIWLGGASPVMLFGLYSRFGNSTGAYAAIFTGSGISIAAIFLQNYWSGDIYPWLLEMGWVDSLDAFLRTISSPFHPWIDWQMKPDKFPINSYEVFFLAIVLGYLAYIIGSAITWKGPYNLDRMLHRGKYAVESEAETIQKPRTIKEIFNWILGIDSEYTTGDKVITWSVFFYSFILSFGFLFLGVIIWNGISPWPNEWWSHYFFFTTLLLPIITGIISSVWFSWGGIVDSIRLFKDLEKRVDNPLDDGRVSGQISIVDAAHVEEVEKEAQK